jgi:hypothetical protein
MIRLAEHVEIKGEMIKLHNILIGNIKMKRPTRTCRMILKWIFIERRIDCVRLVLIWLVTRISGGHLLAQNEPSGFI